MGLVTRFPCKRDRKTDFLPPIRKSFSQSNTSELSIKKKVGRPQKGRNCLTRTRIGLRRDIGRPLMYLYPFSIAPNPVSRSNRTDLGSFEYNQFFSVKKQQSNPQKL